VVDEPAKRKVTGAELEERFEAQRDLLRAVVYRLVGSMAEAEDAVQEAWLRVCGVDVAAIDSLGGWLRTVVTRICIDKLRSGASRREQLSGQLPEMPRTIAGYDGPEEQAFEAESMSRALLVVLDRLRPEERVAFVLHDMFDVPFAGIAPIVDGTPVTTKKLASRARGKVQGTPRHPRSS
jgi:RNA polymerase sigma factor (sigma-70 family)